MQVAVQPTEDSKTILLIDDEPLILDVGSQMLEKLGYTALVAGSRDEAFHILENHKNQIDLIVLDVVMPNSSVMETYEKFRETNSDVKILFTSGYDINGIPMEIFKSGVIGFLPKPFRMRILTEKLNNIFKETNR